MVQRELYHFYYVLTLSDQASFWFDVSNTFILPDIMYIY